MRDLNVLEGDGQNLPSEIQISPKLCPSEYVASFCFQRYIRLLACFVSMTSGCAVSYQDGALLAREQQSWMDTQQGSALPSCFGSTSCGAEKAARALCRQSRCFCFHIML